MGRAVITRIGAVDSELWLAPGGMADQMAQARGITRDEALAMQRDKVPIGYSIVVSRGCSSRSIVVCWPLTVAATGATSRAK